MYNLNIFCLDPYIILIIFYIDAHIPNIPAINTDDKP